MTNFDDHDVENTLLSAFCYYRDAMFQVLV